MPDVFELIRRLCPDGVEYRRLGDITVSLTKQMLQESVLLSDGKYPVINSGRELYGRYSDCNNDGNALVIASRGAYAGFVSYMNEPFWAGALCYPYRSAEETYCATKFLYYYLKSCEQKNMRRFVRQGGIPALNKCDMDKILIPIPPLPVQEEIVRILDAFDTYCNDMTAGLAGELTMRREQFQYWRETLIARQMDHMIALGDLGQFQNGHGISKSELMDEGPVPVIHYGQIYTMYNHAVLKTVSFAGTQTAVSVKAHHGDVVVCLTETADLGFVGKAVAQVSGVDVGVSGDAGVLHLNSEEVDASYLAYVMETQKFQVQKEKCKRGTTVMHLNIPMWKKIRVPIPSLAVQLEIVRILDVFMELERELERELELRVKQFEYYRDHLLVFPEKSAA